MSLIVNVAYLLSIGVLIYKIFSSIPTLTLEKLPLFLFYINLTTACVLYLVTDIPVINLAFIFLASIPFLLLLAQIIIEKQQKQ
jgi:hypothetical protein